MKNTIAITGGAGLIGSHLAEFLLCAGHPIIIIDNLTSGTRENIPDRGTVHFFELDIQNPKVADIYREFKPTTIFHLAASFANELSIADPLTDLEVNARGTLRQLQWALETGVKRFVFASTSCVYAPSQAPLTEKDLTAPYTPYGISKLAGEQYCQFFNSQYHLPFTIIRYFNVYGPREKITPFRGVVPHFMGAALEEKPLLIHGSGLETRDFTFVEDAVLGTVMAASSPLGKNEVFNLGTGKPTTVLELAKMVQDFTDSKATLAFEPLRQWDKTKKRQADIKKIRSLLGFNPKTPLEMGLIKTWQWYYNVAATRKR